MNRPSILVLSFSDLARDPRVHRQLQLLRENYRVTAAGYADPNLPGVEFVPIRGERKNLASRLRAAARLTSRRFEEYYWRVSYIRDAHAALRERAFDLIVANDADTWPLAVKLRKQARLFFDAHEYAPREFEDKLYWRFFYQRYRTWLCREFMPQADLVTTVCDGIADEYARVFGIPRPAVVVNAPPRHDGAPRPTGEKIRIVHHGLASPSRKIEVMIDLMRHLDARFTLDLMMLEPDAAYARALRARAAGEPRIQFRPPVSRAEIIPATRDYDIGLFLLPPTNFNYQHALPNKFFEFVQTRLAIAIGPSPEMARLVRQHGLGVVSADFTPEALARELMALDAAAIDRFKAASHRAASELCWEAGSQTMRQQVEQLLKPCAA